MDDPFQALEVFPGDPSDAEASLGLGKISSRMRTRCRDSYGFRAAKYSVLLGLDFQPWRSNRCSMGSLLRRRRSLYALSGKSFRTNIFDPSQMTNVPETNSRSID